MPTNQMIERETTIVFNDGEDTAVVWTASPIQQRRYAKLGLIPYKIDKRGEGESHWYRVPKQAIKVRLPRQLELSSEEREKRRAVLTRNRTKKASSGS